MKEVFVDLLVDILYALEVFFRILSHWFFRLKIKAMEL